MARRENQVMQITLILCIMIIVGLGISTFIFWQSTDKKTKEAADAKKSLKDTQNASTRYLAEIHLLKRMVNGNAEPYTDAQLNEYRRLFNDTDELSTEVKKMEDAFTKDMEHFAPGYDGPKHYPAIIPHLMEVIVKRNEELKTARALEQQLVKERDAALADLAAAKDAYQKDVAAKVTQINGLNDKIARAERTHVTATDSLQANINKKATEYKTLQVTTGKEIANRQSQIDRQRTIIDKQAEELASLRGETDVFEKHDGLVTSVNQRSERVYVNLGTDDGLMRQTTFSIYNPGVSDVRKATPKGSIEIVQVLDSHLSVGRITSNEISSPIMAGDLIYSSVWKAGRTVTFALIGFMDTNGDGRSDRRLVHNLIGSSGGKIIAELDDNGNRTGTLSHKTRFLVMGDKPTDASNSKLLSEYSKMNEEARLYGIEKISLSKLLDLMGYKGEVKTIRLGKRSNPEDFKVKKDPTAPKSTGDTFRPRRPPIRGKDGAF